MSQWMCKGTAERPMWQGQSDIQENNGTLIPTEDTIVENSKRESMY